MLRWVLLACTVAAAGCEQPGPNLPVPDQWFVEEVEPLEGVGQFAAHFSDGTTVFARKRQLRRLDLTTADHKVLHRFADPILALEVSRDDILYVATDAGVIEARPATIPVTMPTRPGFPVLIFSTTDQVSDAIAAEM